MSVSAFFRSKTASISEMVIGKEKRKNIRRSLRRNKINKFKNKVTFVGVNAAGLSSKLSSFDDMLETLKPTAFFIQETKLRTGGKFKTENTKNFLKFELNRKNIIGGEIDIGAVNDVEPVLICEGDDETEVLVVEIKIAGLRIRCICGYGPQESSKREKKLRFWEKISDEVEDALKNDVCLIFQMDGNLWCGPEVVKNDPNPCNSNGKMFREFLDKYPHLSVVNNSEKCDGLITRRRKTVKKTEESILDFFVICERMMFFLEKMVIDEDKRHVLSNYRMVKGKPIKKDSDHHSLILKLNIEYMKKKPDRIEMFNLKNIECQKSFFEATTRTKALTSCFQQDGKVIDEAKKWFKTLNDHLHGSF